MKYCKHCGKPLKEDSEYCDNCGKKNKSQNKNIILISVTAIVLVIILALVILSFTGNMESSYAYNIGGYNFNIPNGYNLTNSTYYSDLNEYDYTFEDSNGNILIISVTKNSTIDFNTLINTMGPIQNTSYSSKTFGNIAGNYSTLSDGNAVVDSFIFATGHDYINIICSDSVNIQDVISAITQEAYTPLPSTSSSLNTASTGVSTINPETGSVISTGSSPDTSSDSSGDSVDGYYDTGGSADTPDLNVNLFKRSPSISSDVNLRDIKIYTDGDPKAISNDVDEDEYN